MTHISLISASPISLSETPTVQTTSSSVVTQTTSVSTRPSVSQATVPSSSSTRSQASEPTATGSRAAMHESRQPGLQKTKMSTPSQTVDSSLQGHSAATPVRTSPATVTFITNQSTQTNPVSKVKETKLVATSTTSPTQGSPPPPQSSTGASSGSRNRQQRQRPYGRRGTYVFLFTQCYVVFLWNGV